MIIVCRRSYVRFASCVAFVGVAIAVSSLGASAARPKNDTVRIALDWSANVNYLGIYAAIDRGYFAERGIDVKVIPYANTPAETLVKAGKTDLGISYPPDVIINRSQGLKYKAVAGLVAHNTTALAVLASSSVTRPSQLNGTTYGGFGIQSDPPIISAILEHDGVTKPAFKQVVLNTAAIDALAKKRVAYTAVFGGIDDVTARLQGVKLRTFPYRKYLGAAGNYPNLVFVASDDVIAKKADALRRTLAALAQGYEWSAKNPDAAGKILIERNPTELGKAGAIVSATASATAPSFVDANGRWGLLTSSDFAGLSKILANAGVIETTPAPSRLFTAALLPRH